MQNRNFYGVFEPPDVEEMRWELKRGDVLGESKASREQRAAVIIQRRMMPDISYRAGVLETQKTHLPMRRLGAIDEALRSRKVNTRRAANPGRR
jgi:hypothetical protein